MSGNSGYWISDRTHCHILLESTLPTTHKITYSRHASEERRKRLHVDHFQKLCVLTTRILWDRWEVHVKKEKQEQFSQRKKHTQWKIMDKKTLHCRVIPLVGATRGCLLISEECTHFFFFSFVDYWTYNSFWIL